MRKETITKDDGRYLIYYTFPDAPPSSPQLSSPDDSALRWEKGENPGDGGEGLEDGEEKPGSGAEPEA